MSSHRVASAANLRAVGLTLLALGAGGCSEDEPERTSAREGDRPARTTETRQRPKPRPRVERAECPPGVANCRAATGRILYVERVDPDGDGDAHFVLIDRQGISGPGITVIDVAPRLRPRPLPGPGALLSAAGPVYTGSYGQKQIEATVVHSSNGRGGRNR